MTATLLGAPAVPPAGPPDDPAAPPRPAAAPPRSAELDLRRTIVPITALFTTSWWLLAAFSEIDRPMMDVSPYSPLLDAIGIAFLVAPWVATALVTLAWRRDRRAPGERVARLAQSAAFAIMGCVALLSVLSPALVSADVIGEGETVSVELAGRLQLLSTFSVITGLLSSVIALPIWACVGYVVAVHAVRLVALLQMPWEDASGTMFSLAQSLAVCALLMGRGTFLRQIAASVDRALTRSADAVSRAASRSAAVLEAARIDGLVHDHILAALLIASRADHTEDAPMVRRSAAGALAALSEIVAPIDDELAEDCPGAAPVIDVATFAAALFGSVHQLDPTVACSGRGHLAGHPPLPTAAATTLTAAALEAVRNSLRHAAGPAGDGSGAAGRPVRRSVTVHATDAGVSVVVADDGVGFDPATAPEGRYGVSGSILGRMTGLAGGHATLDTAPGRGTTLTLDFADPAVTADPEPLPEPGRRPDLFAEFRPRPTRINPAIAWARTVVATAGEDLDSRLQRVFMVVVIVCLIVLAWLGNDVVGSTWVNVATLAAPFVVATSNMLLVGRDAVRGLPLPGALFSAVGGAAVIAVCIPTYSGHPDPLFALWTVLSCHIAIIFLATEGYIVSALLCATLGSITLAAWGVLGDTPQGLWHGTWPLLLVVWALVSLFHLASVRSIGRSAAISTAHRAELDVAARTAGSEDARRLNARRVDSLARPLLERLAAGERTLPPVRVEAALLEARLRDDLRARCFRGTEVIRAAHDARARGVHVELLDDGALDPTTTALDPTTLADLRRRVILAAVRALDATADGTVVVRVAPTGRDLAATIVARPDSAAATRLEIPAPGGVRPAPHSARAGADGETLDVPRPVKGVTRP